MITAHAILNDLKSKSNEKTRQLYSRHGMDIERVYGVLTSELKAIAKTIKGRQDIACELYASGMMEAMYLAGMVADGAKMTCDQLQAWVESAEGLQMISEYTVPWVTVDSPMGREMATKWIATEREDVAAAGWCTYAGLVSILPDSALDLKEIEGLLETIVKTIHQSPNRVRHTMNGFVIAVGTYVALLTAQAKSASEQIGTVHVNMGDTACKVPDAVGAIAKAEQSGKLGIKRKTIRC